MADKVGVLIDVDSSQAVKGLRDTATALDKVGQSCSQLAAGLNPVAARVDALAAAQSKARGSASELAASQHHLVGAARDAAGAVGALNQKLSNMSAAKEHARGLTSEVDKLAGSLGKASLAGAALMGASVGQFAQFDKGMAYAKARLEGTAQQFRELDSLAKQLGNDERMPQFSAADAGTASGVLAQGGLGMKDILAGGAEGSLLAAGALGTDVVQASQLAADSIRTFNAQGAEQVRVMDRMVMASLKGATSAGELQTAMSQAGSTLQSQHRTSLEAATSFALLGKGMLRGGEAGTGLRGVLRLLEPQTKEAAAMMQHLGLKFTDAHGKFLPMERVAGLLHDRLSGLSDAERQTALSVMFGAENMNAATIIANAGAEGFRAMAQEVNRAGAAADLNAKQNDSLAGGIEALKSTMETAAVMYGETFGPSVRKASGWLSDFASNTIGADNATGRMYRGLATGTTITLAAGAAFLAGASKVVTLRTQLGMLRTQSDAAAASQRGLATALKSSYLTAGVAMVAFEGFKNHLIETGREAWQAKDGLEKLGGGVKWLQGRIMEFMSNPVVTSFRWGLAGLDRATGLSAGFGAIGGAAGQATSQVTQGARGVAGGVAGAFGSVADQIYNSVLEAQAAAEMAKIDRSIATSLDGLGGGGAAGGGGSQAATKQKSAAELRAEADAKLLKQKQDELAATEAKLRIIKAGSQAQAAQTSKAAKAAEIAGDAVEAGRVFNRSQLQCAQAVTTIYKEAGALSQVYTVTTQASRAMLEHPDRFQRLKPGEALKPGDYVAKPYESGVGAFSGKAGWHAMMVTDQGKVAGAPNAGSTFHNQGSQETLPGGWVGFRPRTAAAGAADAAGLEAQRNRLQDEIAGLQGGASGLQLQAERAEAAAKAQEEASQLAKQAAEESLRAAEEERRARIESIEREGAGKMVRAEAGIWQAEQGRSLAGPGQQSQAFGEVLGAHETFWAAREETARALADIVGDTTELERTRLQTEQERSQLLDDEIAKQKAIREEKRRQREEAERQAKAERLQKTGDAATLADILAERAKIQGKGAQTQAALEQKSQALELAHAAELARQGQVIEAERIRNEVLRQQMEGGTQTGKDALQEAVIGGDMGRISDILQQGRRAGGGRAGGGGDDDPVAYAIRNGRSQQPRIIAGAVDERLRREALETARLIEDS